VEWHMTGFHIKYKESEQMKRFCGQLMQDYSAVVDNSLLKEDSNLLENYLIIPYEEVIESYALPSAFEGYKIWKNIK